MKRKKLFFILFFLFIIVLVGCTKKPINNKGYAYQDFSSLKLERNDAYFSDPVQRIDGTKTKTESANYYFEEGISLGERNLIVDDIENLLNYLGYNEQATYYIGTSLHNGIVDVGEGKVVYLNYEDVFKTLDLVIYTMIYVAGDDVRYGIVYGYSQFVAKQLDLYHEDVDYRIDDLIQHIKTNNEIIDLNHPMFVGHFEADDVIRFSKALSMEFVHYLLATIGEEELKRVINQKSRLDHRYYELMYSYLSSLNIEIPSDFVETSIKFPPHSVRYPTKIEGERMVYLFDRNFRNDGMDNEWKYGEFDLGYKNLKSTVIEIEKSIQQTINYINPNFDYLKIQNANLKQGKPTCYFLNDPTVFGNYHNETGGFTTFHYIVLTYIFDVLHEYGHIIAESIRPTFERQYKWLIEGLVTFCNTEFGPYHESYYMELYRIVIEGKPPQIYVGEKDYRRMQLYHDYLQGEQQGFDVWDYEEIIRFENGVKTTLEDYGGRQFCNYLIKQYGIHDFLELYKTRRFEQVYGKSLNDLLLEFESYLSDKYSKYALD